jgi:formylglycine-generating enzyme required for sulfatase activity
MASKSIKKQYEKKEMKKTLTVLSLIILALMVTACSDSGSTDPAGSTDPTDPAADDAVDFNMNYVPSGGPFTMGEDVESTTQEVTLTKNFWMGETEVTQGLWEDVWGTTWPGDDPDGSGYGAGADYPTYYVNWYDAAAFCNLLTKADDSIADTQQVYYSEAGLETAYTKANAANDDDVYVDWDKTGYRLPTEAEWEYSARYIDGTSWNGGDHVSGGPVYTDETDPDKVGDYAWYSGNSTATTQEVGQKTVNALGLRDMTGNVYDVVL